MFNQREYMNQWRKDNPGYNKQWRLDNPDYMSKYNKQWRKDNREHCNEYAKNHRKTIKGKANCQRGIVKRRTREREIVNTLTAQEWLDTLEKYNYRCVYCGVEFDCELLPERDHIIPISKGGNNTKENVVPACRSCNSKKGDKLIREKSQKGDNYERENFKGVKGLET